MLLPVPNVPSPVWITVAPSGSVYFPDIIIRLTMPRPHHHVYVIELSKDVLLEPKFRKNNPNYREGKPCVYVGMTGLNPDVRFDKHKAGIQANTYVTKYGLRLLPDLYEGFNPMSHDEAVDKEIEVGIDLRSAGFGVWQA
jgi:hypothetical protein